MSHRRYKDQVYAQFARIGKALASPKRLELLDLLAQAPRTVESLAGEAQLGLANASQHLQVLRRAGLVDSEKNGLFVTYRLADGTVRDFYRALRGLAENRLAEIERLSRDYREDPGRLEPVERETLLSRARRGEVVVVDVRPAVEYEAGHIPGALSIPLRELESRLDELSRDQRIVAYCRGPYCLLALDAVRKLRSRGFDARRLEDSIDDWRARGFPVAEGRTA